MKTYLEQLTRGIIEESFKHRKKINIQDAIKQQEQILAIGHGHETPPDFGRIYEYTCLVPIETEFIKKTDKGIYTIEGVNFIHISYFKEDNPKGYSEKVKTFAKEMFNSTWKKEYNSSELFLPLETRKEEKKGYLGIETGGEQVIKEALFENEEIECLFKPN